MREICIDTETTGLSPGAGHRLVEVGAVELENTFPTGRTWRSLFNPERSISREASAIHGLTKSKLRGAPLFKERAAGLLAFLGDPILDLIFKPCLRHLPYPPALRKTLFAHHAPNRCS